MRKSKNGKRYLQQAEDSAIRFLIIAEAFKRMAASHVHTRLPICIPMMDWRSFPSEARGFDLILASDVLYEKEYARLLPGIFQRALAPGGMVILADPGRIGVPEFMEACASSGSPTSASTLSPAWCP